MGNYKMQILFSMSVDVVSTLAIIIVIGVAFLKQEAVTKYYAAI
jgi:hypothetical protein